ncbi:hypothetical protein [Kineococcus sp. SYSU DK001]|uniref:hypothetical protein n=1 Tax=Kineococcus sp. SYSU DK001 TaxID=3383122 RepID=UPI003D7E1B23
MRFDPVVEEFLTAAGCRVTEPGAGSVGWTRGEVEHTVRRDPAGFAFSRLERRQQLSRDETATSWDLAQRVVLVKEGRSWRSRQDLPDLPRDLDVRGTGVTVTEHPPFARLEVTRADGTRDVATGLVLAQALRLARTVDQPLSAVVDSLRAVDGGPLFSP